MFDNIAKKIKTLVRVLFALNCVLWLILAIQIGDITNYKNVLFPVLVFAVGVLFSWIGGFTLYGFAELIERVTHIDEMLSSRAYEWEDEQEDEIEDEQEKAFDFELESILKKQIFLDEEKSDEEESFHNTVDQ